MRAAAIAGVAGLTAIQKGGEDKGQEIEKVGKEWKGDKGRGAARTQEFSKIGAYKCFVLATPMHLSTTSSPKASGRKMRTYPAYAPVKAGLWLPLPI